MSQPLKQSISRTVFIVEGNNVAVLVTRIGAKMSEKPRRFRSPESALAWCRANSAGLVYSPAANPAAN